MIVGDIFNKKQILRVLLFLVVLVATSFVFSSLLRLQEFQAVIDFVQNYLPLYIALLVCAKAMSIVYPPLPGAVITLASVPLIGWELAYLVDLVGGVMGAAISFQLGKKYGRTLLHFVLGQTLSEKIAAIKLKEKNQVESAIILKIASGGILSDGLAWGGSLIGFRLAPFITGYAISHVMTTLPIFYFLGASIATRSWLILGVAAATAWFFVYRFKGRYFE